MSRFAQNTTLHPVTLTPTPTATLPTELCAEPPLDFFFVLEILVDHIKNIQNLGRKAALKTSKTHLSKYSSISILIPR